MRCDGCWGSFYCSVAAGANSVFEQAYDALFPLASPAGRKYRDLLFLETRACAFEELFRHCSAVVHHGGSGTTAAAARAGLPQLVCPFMWDQFSWAQVVEWKGLGPPALSRDSLFASSSPHANASASTALVSGLEWECASEPEHPLVVGLRAVVIRRQFQQCCTQVRAAMTSQSTSARTDQPPHGSAAKAVERICKYCDEWSLWHRTRKRHVRQAPKPAEQGPNVHSAQQQAEAISEEVKEEELVQLSDTLQVFTRSPPEASHNYQEIFVHDEYTHGISTNGGKKMSIRIAPGLGFQEEPCCTARLVVMMIRAFQMH